jgi:GTPase SAR1 family protein
VAEGMSNCYKKKLLPLEEMYKFHEFHMTKLEDPDFDCKPMVLLVGQYSTGKTTFIKYLLEEEFPGMRIGPEPTTDGFCVLHHGNNNRVIPGNALVVDSKRCFRSLSAYGNSFLNRFSCSEMKSSVLEQITLIDTPGILSGEKQSIQRGYDFTGVLEWFAQRVDRIILLFDAHKLDISDEFRRGIEALHGYDEKIRIVLNKSDMISTQQLMRVYGALMWSLGKVIKTPEVTRVYIGSFWDQPLKNDENRKLFELEESDLFADLQVLPKNATIRKMNDLIKRARLAKVHVYIIQSIKSQLPLIGKDAKKKELINKLSDIYASIQRQYELSPADFPEIERMKENLRHCDFSKMPAMKPKMLEAVDSMLSDDIGRLMNMIPHEVETAQKEETDIVRGGVFASTMGEQNPFQKGVAEGFNLGKGQSEWIVQQHAESWTPFDQLVDLEADQKISGSAAKKEMVKRTKLPKSALAKIWTLSDIDKDGCLDEDEYNLAMYLIQVKVRDDDDIPAELPEHLIPPQKRKMIVGNNIPLPRK